jgi:ATP-dependent Clp protease ATP-binding subunit ClpC
VNSALKKHFRPEFLGRIDEIIVFNSLGKDVCEKIVNKELSFVSSYLNTKGIKIAFDDSIISFLLEKGFDSEYGARPVIKTIKKNVSDRIADYLLNNEDTKSIKVKIVDKEKVEVEAGE